FTNITASDKLQICIEDGFNITDGHPTFDKKWTDEMPAEQFAGELIKHHYQNGWSLPPMPAV
ncbi:MAG: gfo/Idh/MocA family oxidoreductase, partial [Bacteroidales bacterium]|nr:gfo/Idh/MocA family oxidoreductase [Bacteroidales bacterium]